jgi:hypothetical protein
LRRPLELALASAIGMVHEAVGILATRPQRHLKGVEREITAK